MGKATGFLEYERSESSASEPLERIRNAFLPERKDALRNDVGLSA